METPSFSPPKIFLEWQTPAYLQAEKSKGWYLLMGLIVLLFVIYDVMTGGYVVSMTFLLFAAVYYFLERNKAPIIKVAITDVGIRFGGQFFQYREIQSFWILSEDGLRTLHIKPISGINREIAIFIPDETPLSRVRELLKPQIAEEEGKKESFSDQLIRNLGL